MRWWFNFCKITKRSFFFGLGFPCDISLDGSEAVRTTIWPG